MKTSMKIKLVVHAMAMLTKAVYTPAMQNEMNMSARRAFQQK